MNPPLGKVLMGIGGVLVLVGLIVYFFHDKLGWIGRLPGDVRLERENFRLYMPLATCLLLTVLINLMLWLLRRFF